MARLGGICGVAGSASASQRKEHTRGGQRPTGLAFRSVGDGVRRATSKRSIGRSLGKTVHLIGGHGGADVA